MSEKIDKISINIWQIIADYLKNVCWIYLNINQTWVDSGQRVQAWKIAENSHVSTKSNSRISRVSAGYQGLFVHRIAWAVTPSPWYRLYENTASMFFLQYFFSCHRKKKNLCREKKACGKAKMSHLIKKICWNRKSFLSEMERKKWKILSYSLKPFHLCILFAAVVIKTINAERHLSPTNKGH